MNIVFESTLSAHHGSADETEKECRPSFLEMLEKHEKNKNDAQEEPSSKHEVQVVEEGAVMLLSLKKSIIDSPTCIIATPTCKEVTAPHKNGSNKQDVVPSKKKKRTIKKAKLGARVRIKKKCEFRIKGDFYVKGNKVITEKDKLCLNSKGTGMNQGNVRCNVCMKCFCHVECRNCFEKHRKQWENKKCENATFTIISLLAS